MRYVIAILVAAFVLMGAKAPVTGEITVATPTPTYQQWIDFDWSVTGRPKGYEYPMVVVSCYQAGELVYRQLDYPDSQSLILGGGWSIWVGRGGGDAECDAGLYLYPGLHSGAPVLLDTVEFHANG